MTKKCIICGEEANLKIKDTSDYYCGECAKDNFGDVSVLIKVEEEAKALKKAMLENQDNEEEE